MSYLIIAVLGLALAMALIRLRDQRRKVRDFRQAMAARQPFLRKEAVRGGEAGDWDRLRAETNNLIEEVTRLQQQGSDRLAQLEATLGSLQEAVLIVDADNYVLLANQAFAAIFPRAQDILHQRMETALRSVPFLEYVETVRAGRAAPQQEFEFTEGENAVWLEVTGTLVAPPAGERGPWALFVLHDITRQKRLENIRKDFVANVSHELRTPLSVIKGYVETLVDGHRDMPLEDRERFLQTVQRHTDRLHSILQDLLTLSRLESNDPGLRREPVDLPGLAGRLVAEFRERPAANGHRITLVADPAAGAVEGDALKLTQVFENLLDNAIKYTPPGSQIDVQVRRIGAEIEVGVRDNGPGIPPADLPRLFERFYRVDKGRSREQGGTGLGLSIVKHIVQLHGGRVWVESVPGKGAAFFVALPAGGGSAASG
jgi:two-component system phosphate regulon sensor histidine kinase PhoR